MLTLVLISRLTGEVLQIVQSVPQLVKGMTGVDVTAQVLKFNYSYEI